MTNRNYPTRMHEILGVEPDERFKVKHWHEENEAFVNKNGDIVLVCANSYPQQLDALNTCMLVNHPELIIRKPRLTEEQIAQLKAVLKLGANYIAKDSHCRRAHAYCCPPHKKDGGAWDTAGFDEACFMIPHSLAINELVSWRDPEPLDIVQTLRDAGVEV